MRASTTRTTVSHGNEIFVVIKSALFTIEFVPLTIISVCIDTVRNIIADFPQVVALYDFLDKTDTSATHLRGDKVFIIIIWLEAAFQILCVPIATITITIGHVFRRVYAIFTSDRLLAGHGAVVDVR